MSRKSKWDVIVVGAGAAGLMCALVAGKRGRRVLLLEKNAKVGRKILISGGGRCNFTNTGATHEHYYSQNIHFSRSALSRYLPDDFIKMVQSRGIAFHEKKLGQLFCNDSARDIVDMLVDECESNGVTIACEADVTAVDGDGPYRVQSGDNVWTCSSLVIASGGLSIPKIGASDFGYGVARDYGMKVTELRPALVPFTLGQETFPGFKELAGTSLDAEVTAGGKTFRENILFTHWGLSGPAILQASLYWDPGAQVTINLLPEKDVASWLLDLKRSESKVNLATALKRELPTRFVDAFIGMVLGMDKRPLGECADKKLREIGQTLNAWSIVPDGTQGYKKAEVTRGGVVADGLSQKTMESRKNTGLFFIGEVVDVTGWLGGYNFQWAWASAVAAGESV